jgi:hypothetical protein
MSSEAVAWVQDHWGRDLPRSEQRRLIVMMLAIARYVDADGRGCRASATTLADRCRLGERQGKVLLQQLRDGKHIQLGDQALVVHLRADQRPTVYDLVVPRGALHCTPPAERGAPGNTPRGALPTSNGVHCSAPETPPTGGDPRARRGARAREGAIPPADDALALDWCRFVPDPQTRDRCGRCGWPRAHQRHGGVI